jgi:hypothetical protein
MVLPLRWGQIWLDFTGLDLQKRGHKSGGGEEGRGGGVATQRGLGREKVSDSGLE